MEHSPSPAEFHHDFSSINFATDYSALAGYPAYEIHNMSSPRLGGFNSLSLNSTTSSSHPNTSNGSNALQQYYSSSSADASPSPYISASPLQTPVNFHPSNGLPVNGVPGRPFSPSQSISPPLTNLDVNGDNLAGPTPFSIGAPAVAAIPIHHPHAHAGGPPHHPHGRARAMSSGTGSPSSSYASAGSNMSGLGPHRTKSYGLSNGNGVGLATKEKRRRPAAKREDDDDDDDDEDDDGLNGILPSSEIVVAKRREEIRRQRIESEQRRRDELRDGYRKLKEVLPASNQKSSKVSLLDRATTHIRYLELSTAQMVQKVAELEAETARLRQVNETLMLSAAERSRIAAATNTGSY